MLLLSICLCFTYKRSRYEDSKRVAYIEEEGSHAFQWTVEGSEDFGLLDSAVCCMSKLSVALKHACWVTPAHLLQVVETP